MLPSEVRAYRDELYAEMRTFLGTFEASDVELRSRPLIVPCGRPRVVGREDISRVSRLVRDGARQGWWPAFYVTFLDATIEHNRADLDVAVANLMQRWEVASGGEALDVAAQMFLDELSVCFAEAYADGRIPTKNYSGAVEALARLVAELDSPREGNDRPKSASKSVPPSSFKLRRLVQPDSNCGYEMVAFDNQRSVFICFSLEPPMVAIQTRLESEENSWINADYEHMGKRLAFPIVDLTALVQAAFGETDYYFCYKPADHVVELAFGKNNLYYEVELQRTPSGEAQRNRGSHTGWVEARPSPAAVQLFAWASATLDQSLSFVRSLAE
jgi:hypothetical protein